MWILNHNFENLFQDKTVNLKLNSLRKLAKIYFHISIIQWNNPFFHYWPLPFMCNWYIFWFILLSGNPFSLFCTNMIGASVHIYICVYTHTYIDTDRKWQIRLITMKFNMTLAFLALSRTWTLSWFLCRLRHLESLSGFPCGNKEGFRLSIGTLFMTLKEEDLECERYAILNIKIARYK